MKEKFSLKDALFNREKIVYLASLFKRADKKFKEQQFVEEVMKQLLQLELKQRIVWIAEVLERYVPKDFVLASRLLIAALPEPIDPTKTDNDFGEFIFAPLGEYVVRNGLQKKYLKTSLATLREITMRFSMEDAMRSFLNAFPRETLTVYDKWVFDKNYHVRRLVSESTRPLLPWSRRLSLPHKESLRYLEILYADNTRYVTRSVANHLNDISKKDPKLVVLTLSRWQKEGKQNKTELAWITKHALRTLLKKGNTDALLLLGYNSATQVGIEEFSLSAQSIAKGEILSFSFSVKGKSTETLLIDYVVDFVKANGTIKSKVFKIKKCTIKKGESLKIIKNHHFKANATTFTLYEGQHAISLQINGVIKASQQFTLY